MKLADKDSIDFCAADLGQLLRYMAPEILAADANFTQTIVYLSRQVLLFTFHASSMTTAVRSVPATVTPRLAAPASEQSIVESFIKRA